MEYIYNPENNTKYLFDSPKGREIFKSLLKSYALYGGAKKKKTKKTPNIPPAK